MHHSADWQSLIDWSIHKSKHRMWKLAWRTKHHASILRWLDSQSVELEGKYHLHKVLDVLLIDLSILSAVLVWTLLSHLLLLVDHRVLSVCCRVCLILSCLHWLFYSATLCSSLVNSSLSLFRQDRSSSKVRLIDKSSTLVSSTLLSCIVLYCLIIQFSLTGWLGAHDNDE